MLNKILAASIMPDPIVHMTRRIMAEIAITLKSSRISCQCDGSMRG